MTIQNGMLLLVTLAAAATDITSGKVYNRLTYPAIALGLLLSVVAAPPAVAGSILGAGATFAMYYLLHRMSGLGAGDVKLMTAVGAIKGFPFVAFASFYILCAGSVGGLLVLAWKKKLGPSLKYVFGTLGGIALPAIRPDVPEGGLTTVPFAPFILMGCAYALYLESLHGPFTLSWWI